MAVRVLKDPVEYRRRNLEVCLAGGTISWAVSLDGSNSEWRTVGGVATSTDDEWVEVEDHDAATAHYAKLGCGGQQPS